MPLTALALAAALAAAPSTATSSSTAPPSSSTSSLTAPGPAPREAAAYPLAEAEAALRAGIHKKCIELAQQALATGRLDTPAVARAWLVRGRCSSIDGDPDRAERAYAVAVRVQPDIALPVDDAAFARVRPEGTAPSSAMTLAARAEAVAVTPSEQLVVIAVAAQDDLGVGRAFALVDADEREVARAPIERAPDAVGDAFVRPTHRFSGLPVEGLRARLLDRHGNVLRDVPVVVDAAARDALIAAGATPRSDPPAPSGSRWVTLVGAGAATAGFVTAMAAGVTFANALQADPSRVIDDEWPALAGFIGGVGLFVVGGGLIVFDQRAD